MFRLLATALIVLAVSPRQTAAMDGVPPFAWFPFGAPMPEYGYAVSFNPDGGIGTSYEGGVPARSMMVKDYAMASILGRYGMWKSLEVYGALPYYWGRSPQEYRDPWQGEREGTISGSDFGDVALGLKLAVWRSADEAKTVSVAAACVLPMGSNVWTDYPKATFYETFSPELPELTLGDGAYKALVSADLHEEGDDFRLDALAGYLYKFEMHVGEFDGKKNRIVLRQPSPLLFRAFPAFRVGRNLWLEGRAEGFWAPRGRIRSDLSRAGLENIMDGYLNLVESHGAAWAGAGVKWDASDKVRAGLSAEAPVAAHRYYRSWRICAVIERSWAK